MNKSSFDLDVGLTLKSRFLQEQADLLSQAGADLAAFADTCTGGQGQAWLRQTLSPSRVHLKGLSGTAASLINRKPTSIVFPRVDIWLAARFERMPAPLPHIVHELAHVIDNRLARSSLPATIFGGGPADRLVSFLGGRPRGLRFINGLHRLPEEYRWRANNGYGNRASAEYFAETLAWCVYDPGCLPSPVLLEWIQQCLFK